MPLNLFWQVDSFFFLFLSVRMLSVTFFFSFLVADLAIPHWVPEELTFFKSAVLSKVNCLWDFHMCRPLTSAVASFWMVTIIVVSRCTSRGQSTSRISSTSTSIIGGIHARPFCCYSALKSLLPLISWALGTEEEPTSCWKKSKNQHHGDRECLLLYILQHLY